MKYVMALALLFLVTACGSNTSRQVLPPELQGGTIPGQPPANRDPLSNLPFDPPEEGNESEAPPQTVTETEIDITENEPQAPLIASNCEALTYDLETSFADINFCETNNDCAVAAGSCPFGCFLFHNVSIDFADYEPALTAYQEGCNPCEYQCAEAPRVADRRCVEGRCVDVRFLDS